MDLRVTGQLQYPVMACGGREGSSSCSDDIGANSRSTADDAWLWVLLTVALWVALLLGIWLMRTCTHRQRRHKFLNRVLKPIFGKFGVKVNWGTAPPDGGRPVAMAVFCTAQSDQPPSYEMAMAYVNTAFTQAPLAPPSYEDVAALTLEGGGSGNPCHGSDVNATSEEANVTVISTAT